MEETCADQNASRRAQHCLCPISPLTSSLEHTHCASLRIANQNSIQIPPKTLKPSLPPALHPEHVLTLRFMPWPHGHQDLPSPPCHTQKALNVWRGDGCPAGMLGSQESKQKGRGMREGAEWPSLNLSPRQPQSCLEPPACQALAPQSQRGG